MIINIRLFIAQAIEKENFTQCGEYKTGNSKIEDRYASTDC